MLFHEVVEVGDAPHISLHLIHCVRILKHRCKGIACDSSAYDHHLFVDIVAFKEGAGKFGLIVEVLQRLTT